MRLDSNYKKKNVKNTNTWRLNNTFLNSQQITEEIKRQIKIFLETVAMKTRQLKIYGMQQKQFPGRSL